MRPTLNAWVPVPLSFHTTKPSTFTGSLLFDPRVFCPTSLSFTVITRFLLILFVRKAFAAVAMISLRTARQQTQRNAGDTWAAKLPDDARRDHYQEFPRALSKSVKFPKPLPPTRRIAHYRARVMTLGDAFPRQDRC